MKTIWIDEVDSTNSYLREHREEVPAMTMVAAHTQRAGRGQRGNSWESEPGKNLTFSFRIEHPELRPTEQFAISEAVALGMVEFLRTRDIEAMVKWPNDIYVDNRKISGILIENSILGDWISDSIVGIGLNVNQTIFKSDAPIPVSMIHAAMRHTHYPPTFTEYNLRDVAASVGEVLETYVGRLSDPKALHEEYKARLWRGDGGLYPFRDRANGERFEASIKDVELTGHLLLQTATGERLYAFKEVAFL